MFYLVFNLHGTGNVLELLKEIPTAWLLATHYSFVPPADCIAVNVLINLKQKLGFNSTQR